MLVILAGIVTDSKLVQFRKAYVPVERTLLGIVIVFREEHPLNAYDPIVVMVFPILTEDKLEQF